MLPRLRASAKKTIGLLERRTNETPGFVRNQHKAELPPDAKATPAATPKPPLPSTGASSSASSSSSSFFSYWQSRSSIPKIASLFGAGALGALATGALIYSLGGKGDGGGDDTKKKKSKGEGESPFFNRSAEKEEFEKKLNNKPGAITVLIGPPSCGKSRFLKEVVDQLLLGQDPPPVIFINSRLVQVDGPEEISKALCDGITSQKNLLNVSKFPDLVQAILEQVSGVAGVKTPVGDVSVNLAKLAEWFKKDEGNLTKTIEKLKIVFTSTALLPRKPVIVIDEANMLMDWKEEDSKEKNLKHLLAFLVAISKEANLVHVHVATSDFFLVTWLKLKGLATNNFVIKVLGDLTEEEARGFFLGDGVKGTWAGIINVPSSPKPVPSGTEEHWPAIYERCGGNIGMLQQCVIEARAQGNWKDALDIVVANSRSAIEQGFKPKVIPKRDELPDWFEDQWATVLQCLTTAPHHAVLRNELAKNLGKEDEERGDEIILSMVKYNLLALRPYSTLARDLPREVYGVDEEEVVTLPSPGHVWAAKRILLRRKSDADKAAAELVENAKSKPKKYFGLL
ncbi:putative ATP-binding protein [Nannochloris sp. 'desiccata']|nr:putative ATP-binding protein [Chlorella desiccata (nom. nud.)]